MQEYLENNLDKILGAYFECLEGYISEDVCSMKDFSKFIDDISFYKEWSKDTKYRASIFLIEIEDEKEGEKISD